MGFICAILLFSSAVGMASATTVESHVHQFGSIVMDPARASAEKHNHRQRRFVEVVPNVQKVGACELTEITLGGIACQSLLYKPYRENTNNTCRSQLPVVRDCAHKLYDTCLSNISASTAQRAKHIYDTAMQNATMVKMICDEGGIPKTIPASLPPLCTSSFPTKYTQCVEPFHVLYEKDRRDVAMCGVYQEATDCTLREVKALCSGDVIKYSLQLMKGIDTKKANPFCSMIQGGADANIIIKGKLISPDPTSPASPSSAPFVQISQIAIWVCTTAGFLVVRYA